MSKSYFEFYGIPVSFYPDDENLREIFYRWSKKYHPDFYTQESAEKQIEALELSTLNNKAYSTLSDFDSRMQYILEIAGVFGEEGENKLPVEFLGEMMEINEAAMELEIDFDQNAYQDLYDKVRTFERDLLNGIHPVLISFNESQDKRLLTEVKDFFLKKRYVLRILENLDRFASA